MAKTVVYLPAGDFQIIRMRRDFRCIGCHFYDSLFHCCHLFCAEYIDIEEGLDAILIPNFKTT
jgi:hypothetical protein